MHPALHAARQPDKPAIVMAGSGATTTFFELEAASNQAARQLRALGLRRGDVVATLFDNAAEVFVLGWATRRAGLYQTSVSNKLSAGDIAYTLRDSGATLLIVSPAFADLARAALATMPDLPAYRWSGADDRLADWSQATRIASGTVWINETQHLTPLAAFGEMKQSGLGVEGGAEGLLNIPMRRRSRGGAVPSTHKRFGPLQL